MIISDAAFHCDARMPLPKNEVHLWRVDLSSVANGEQRWEQIISEDERARAVRFRFPRDRQYFSATRALLRILLACHAAGDPKELVFHYSDKKKPSLNPGQPGEQIKFDVSLKSGELNALLSTRPNWKEATNWSLQEVPVGDGYVAALCVQGHGWRLRA